MITFVPITRISGSISITVSLRDGDGAMRGTLPIETTFSGEARKNGIADVAGLISITTSFSGSADESKVGHGDASFEPLISLGSNYPYSEGRASFEPLTTLGMAGLPEGAYAIGEASFPPLTTFGIGLTGGVGHGDASFEPMVTLGANYDYSAGDVSFLPLTTYGVSELLHPNIILSRGRARAHYHIVAPASVIEIASTATVVRRAHVIAGSTGIVTSQASVRWRAHVVARSRGIVESRASYRGQPVETWVFTLDGETTPISRYLDFDFNSFVEHEGRYYAADAGGIYELGGENDDSIEIDGYILTGRRQEGVDRQTRVPIVYLIGRSTGKLHCRVIDERGVEYDYRAERALGNVPSRQRVKLGLGLKMSEWQYRIGNENGEDFELQDAGSLVDVLMRRVG